jgi:Flp pilus assembly protein TadG
MPDIASRWKRHRRERGQSLVEFALVLPVFLILVFGIIDFSMALRSYVTLTNATREGARYGALGATKGTFPASCSNPNTVVGRVCEAASGLDLDDVRVTYPDAGGKLPGNSVVVSARYDYEFITPVGDIMNFLTGGSFPTSIRLSSSADMRIE